MPTASAGDHLQACFLDDDTKAVEAAKMSRDAAVA